MSWIDTRTWTHMWRRPTADMGDVAITAVLRPFAATRATNRAPM